MSNPFINDRHYASALSNLMAALGGGTILGKGVGVINSPYLQGGSILAFFIGTVLGLVFLQAIPKHLSKKIAQTFSMLCVVLSLCLFFIYTSHAVQGTLTGSIGIVFFWLLSTRFGFWFYSRVMRADAAAGQQQSIAWVELGYYVGMILGLILWKLVHINIGLGAALIIDACLQFAAGLLDVKSNALEKNTSSDISTGEMKASKPSVPYNHAWGWRLSSAVVLMTVGVQVIIFSFSHYVSGPFSSYILATFYLGVAAAAFICNKYKIYLTWDTLACICSDYRGRKISFNVLSLIVLSVVSVIVCMDIITGITDLNFMHYPADVRHYLICLFVFIAAFIYEVLSLAILDRIGYEEKLSDHSGMIMRTYGLMGITAAISLWILGITGNPFTLSAAVLTLSCISAIMVMVKRKSHPI